MDKPLLKITMTLGRNARRRLKPHQRQAWPFQPALTRPGLERPGCPSWASERAC